MCFKANNLKFDNKVYLIIKYARFNMLDLI